MIVIRRGFEPRTDCLEGSCSIQLSYRTIFFAGAKIGIIFDISKFLVNYFEKYSIIGTRMKNLQKSTSQS